MPRRRQRPLSATEARRGNGRTGRTVERPLFKFGLTTSQWRNVRQRQRRMSASLSSSPMPFLRLAPTKDLPSSRDDDRLEPDVGRSPGWPCRAKGVFQRSTRLTSPADRTTLIIGLDIASNPRRAVAASFLQHQLRNLADVRRPASGVTSTVAGLTTADHP